MLVLILAISMLTACNMPTKDSPISGTKPTNTNEEQTQNISDDRVETEPTETDPTVDMIHWHEIELDYSAFEATGESYTKDDPIGSFPYFAGDEDFWRLARFNVFYADSADGSAPSKWDELKDIPVNKIKVMGTGVNDYLPLMAFAFNETAQSQTIGEAILKCNWIAMPGTLETATQIETYFPIFATTVSEMIVANYGQPSVVYVDEESGSCNIGYYVGEFDLIINVEPAPGEEGDSLPYIITVELTLLGN
jgi:hypothetical protein